MSTPWIILATIAFYFLLLFVISWITGRKADNAGFFTGNRKSPWYLVAIAMIGAPISGVTFISVPGAVAANGYSYMQMVLGFFVGALLVSLVLIPMFYRMNLVSIYGYLENRFGLASYRTGAWFFFISKMLGASVRFFVVCVVLQSLVFDSFGIPFSVNVILTVALIWLYSYQGGVKSLIWTDSLKTICLVGSLMLLRCGHRRPPRHGHRRPSRRRYRRQDQPDILLRQSIGRPLLLEAISRWSVYAYSHDRP